MGRDSKASYNSYLSEYNKQLAKMTKRGLTMEPKYGQAEYKILYEARRNTLKELVKTGKRKAVGNVNQSLVRDQAYVLRSTKQAKALAKAAKELGLKTTVTKIRNNPDEVQDLLTRKKYELLSQGMTVKQAKSYISKNIFGSE